MGDLEGVVVVSEGHDYVGGKHGSGIVSRAADELGMRGVGGVCEMFMCLARGGVAAEWIRGLGFGSTNPLRTEGVLDVLRWCRWGVGRGFGPGSGRVAAVLCLYE